eukprot:3821717-Prymnesium_polylepis.1
MVSEHASIWKELFAAAEAQAAFLEAADREQKAICSLARLDATRAALLLSVLTAEWRTTRLMLRLQSSRSECERVAHQLQVSVAARCEQTQRIKLLRKELLEWTGQPAVIHNVRASIEDGSFATDQ